jgi:hypothetical protein
VLGLVISWSIVVLGSIFNLPHDEIDILSPIKGTYQNNNLFYFPEAYERLENIVKTYPADKHN